VSKKTRLIGGYLKGRPIWCSWQVTPRCESGCAFCEHRAEGGGESLDLSGCRRVVKELSALGSLMVSLSGGDPFLRADLPEIIALIAGDHVPFLTTSGSLVSRERARAVWKAGLRVASVRLHSADAGRHDGAAGVPGAFARASAGLAALASERLDHAQHVNVKVRLDGPESVEGLPDLLTLAAGHGATVSVEPSFPLPGGLAGFGGLSAKLAALRARHPNLRASGHFLGHMDQALGEGVGGCLAGRAFFNVDHRGRVSKCVEFRAKEDRLGTLGEDGTDQVLHQLREAQAANRCRACWYSSRGEVEGLYTWRGLLGAVPELLRA